jgi:hypothetical protein
VARDKFRNWIGSHRDQMQPRKDGPGQKLTHKKAKEFPSASELELATPTRTVSYATVNKHDISQR